ncbi:MAG: hypothetical protein QOD02_628 [Mycobacterium sp.]|jgi:hypothetical protein|nr:hypothetical protein [Mycobacterium sp.]MDT5167313.1 hypothetical protein [Mycobacterium sp.]MDT5200692.1 hypothetical protein [Mycobacterium sp.]MDT5254313.1 hypothetical protein [Mycobacterium sp.]MDT5310231.1 hypothetical protein [Mycobacterium sp.]
MTRDKVGWVAFNAMMVILGACLSGMPYNEAQKASAGRPLWFHVPGDPAKWNLVHMEGLVNAVLMLAIVAVVSQLTISPLSSRVLFWALVAMGWGNFLGALAGALGNDAVMDMGPTHDPIAFGLFSVAAVGVLVAIAVVARVGVANGKSREDSQSSDSSAGVGAS